MKHHELQSIVASQINAATGTLNSDIADHRGELMKRYLGEPYGDEVVGLSSVVMSDVSDTIEWIMPELMDIFTAGDDAVEFEPMGKEDEDAAKQETAVVNYIFGNKNEGFLTLYTWFKDALIQKNGIIKSYWDEREVTEIEEYDDLTLVEFLQILSDLEESGEVTILEQSWEPEEVPTEPLRVKLEIKKQLQEYRTETVPPEDFLITPRWHSIFMDGCPFQAHRAKKPVSELIEMGFDRKQVEALPDAQDDLDEEEVQRFNSRNNTEFGENDEPDPSMREVTLFECYIRADQNGDGIAELLQVFVGGEQNEILKWSSGKPAVEEVQHAPFDALTPIIMSHKFFGRSIAELVEDLQKIRTVLVRQALDNIYVGNNQRPHVDETMMTENTMQDLLNPAPGHPIRGKGPMAGVSYVPVPNVTSEILGMVEYVDGLRESRTGVTKYNQGLDADSLNKTATGIQNIMNASQKKILLIARIFAETGVKSLMRRIHRDLRKGPIKTITARLRNEWVEVNPRVWKDRADMSVSVGLGTGNKDNMLQRLNMILERQIQGMEVGLSNPQKILHTLHKMVELSDLKAPELFFDLGEPPQQSDPTEGIIAVEREKAMIKGQVDLQKEQIKQAGEAERSAQKAENDEIRMASDLAQAQMADDTKRDLAMMDAAVKLALEENRALNATDLELIRSMNTPQAYQ